MIDEVIGMAAAEGRTKAAKFLEERDVPLRVIARVLDEQEPRLRPN